MDSKVIYKLSITSALRPGILPFVITLLTVIIFFPLMVYAYGTSKQLGVWLVAITWVSYTAIPPCLLHISYSFRDKGKMIEIDNHNKFLILTDRSSKRNVNYEEIERIEKYHSETSFDKFIIANVQWKTYYYYKIIVKDKEPIYITRMLVEKLENKIEGVNFKYIRVVYPFIRNKK